MKRIGFGFLMVLALGLAGCAPGAPKRASDIQNLNGISDDISAVGMTRTVSSHAADPNSRTTYPHSYQTTGSE